VNALESVLADLPAIGKNSVNQQQGYKFRGIEDITAALKPLFAKHELVVTPHVLERRDAERTTRNGGVLYIVDIFVRFRFSSSGVELATAEVWGQGSDSGDKAVQKAMTSAFKTALSVVFCISDAEYDAERHNVPETVRGAEQAGTDAAGEVPSVPVSARAEELKEHAQRLRDCGIDVFGAAKATFGGKPPAISRATPAELDSWENLLLDLEDAYPEKLKK